MDDFVGVVFSSICDVARNLASVVKRNAPDLYIDYLHLPQNMSSAASQAYTRAEFDRFRNNLAAHIGRAIPDSAIARSLNLYNDIRRLTRMLYDERKSRPGSISAADLRAVVQAGTRMMPEDFILLLEEIVAAVRDRKVHPRDSVKVVIEGAFCEQPPIELLDAIEAAGCQVNDDDMVIGWRLFSEDIISNGDALGALARAYLHDSVYTSVRHDNGRPRTEGLALRMQRSGAEAVLFTPAKFCEPALLDYVLFRQRLDEAGVPHLKLEFEEKMWTFDAPRTEVETFVESLLFD
jgi:benzoyl-CoA reductase subunit C